MKCSRPISFDDVPDRFLDRFADLDESYSHRIEGDTVSAPTLVPVVNGPYSTPLDRQYVAHADGMC